ncbi:MULTISPECIES: LysR family transcriptional regulator [Hoeflea]|jgi:DNA-binding transcriptional LysR family regulator|uniref:LysR family transcriptional regulator n=1 Tax=Hoeflea alexandrii TaxID=288436 RepID=A0ABT1CL60_9HYPH|nr:MULTISPECIES: LysR family transcriptional regulator [Hoeflea]MBV6650550.1 LysR family transcriptional regulator [Hoeflea sp.]MCO6406950.1 LysR family transcriptional regulator [Hoeflea alexandrii]VVT03047.1 Transcriptional regulator [Hoeflea sp. EC-HK425]
MQIELLETFLDLMETKSFNRTADRLNLKQSTVSARINTLEAMLGKKLFTRSRAGTQPTPAGHRLLDHARALRHQWNEARRSVASTGNFDQSMRIGIQHDLASNHIADWVAGFRTILPKAAFYIDLDFSNQMSVDLLAGELDLSILYTPKNLPDLHNELIGEVGYRLISSKARRIAEIEPASYIFTRFSPAFEKVHNPMMADLAEAPLSSGQNITVCGLLSSLGGSAYVLEESASEMVASQGFDYVDDAPRIPQGVYCAMHLRNRHSHVHRRLLESVRRQLAADPGRG